MATDWTPELTLNHDELDPEHLTVFRLLKEAVQTADSQPQELLPKVNAFAEALLAHVRHEEAVMVDMLYPDRARHKASHDLLLSDVFSVESEIQADGPTPHALDTLKKRVSEWLRFHTRENDGPLGEYLARRLPRPSKVESPTRRPEGARRLS